MKEQVYQELDQYLYKKLNTELQELQVPDNKDSEVRKVKISLSNNHLFELFCKQRKGGLMSLNKVGHEISHIKSVLVTYYPDNNALAINCTKMVVSQSNLGWEAEIEVSTKGYFRFSYQLVCSENNYVVEFVPFKSDSSY